MSSDAVGRPPPETMSPTNNIAVFFTHWVEREPDRVAIVFPREQGLGLAYDAITFRELDDDANRVGHALRALGVEKDDKVLIMIPMSRPLYALLVAVMKIGATAVFLDPWVKLDQMSKAAELVQPKAFVGIPKAHWLRLLSAPFRQIPLKMVALGKTPFARLLGRTMEGMLRSEAKPLEPVTCQLDDTALITFTTGSTGTPKGSNRTEFFLNAQGVALTNHLPRLPGDVDMPALPVFVLNNLGAGIPSVLPLVDFKRIADVEPRLILEEIDTWKVTTMGGSPAYLEPIARHCLEKTITLRAIRAVVTGGAPVSPELLRMLQQVCPNAHGNIEILYGSTEAEPVAKIEADVVLGETAVRTEAGEGNCVGLPVPDIELKIVAATPDPWTLDGRGWEAVELPQGEVGELLVTGDHVQKDYYRNPEAVVANKVTGPDGVVWHRMGDLGYLDEQGRIWLVGRVNNAVRAGERWLYPIQVESRVETLSGVRRAALLGLESGVLLVVVPREGSGDDDLREQVLGACREADWPIEEVRFRAAIPLDPRHNAKIDHRALKAELAEEGSG